MFYRSTIARLHEDGDIEAIHLYFDTNESHSYGTLHSYYRIPEFVDQLFELGDLLYLGRHVGSARQGYKPTGEACLAFKRDDGLTGMESQRFGSIESWLLSFHMCQVAYLFDGKDWLRFERIETERKTKDGNDILGFWVDAMGFRVTGIFNFANLSKRRGLDLPNQKSLIQNS